MKNFKVISSAIFTLILVLNSFLIADETAPSSDNGDLTNPYQMATQDNLLWLSTNYSEWGKCFIQTTNIDASATSTWNSNRSGGTSLL